MTTAEHRAARVKTSETFIRRMIWTKEDQTTHQMMLYISDSGGLAPVNFQMKSAYVILEQSFLPCEWF